MNSGCCRGRPPFPLNADFFFFLLFLFTSVRGFLVFPHPKSRLGFLSRKEPSPPADIQILRGGSHLLPRSHPRTHSLSFSCSRLSPALQSPLLSAPGCRPLMAPVTPLWASASGEPCDYKLPLLLLQLPVVFSADLFGLKQVDLLTFPAASSNAPAILGLSCFIVVFIPRLVKIITVPTRVNVSPPPTTTVLAGSAA